MYNFKKKSLYIVSVVVFILWSVSAFSNTPLSWKQLSESEYIPGGRTTEVQQKYDHFLLTLKQQNKPIEYLILEQIFGFEENGINRCIEIGCPNQYVLTKNDYGYNLENGIYQLVLFSTNRHWNEQLLLEKSEILLKKHLGKLYGSQGIEWVVRINPPSKRSVKGLAHAHIFLRDSRKSKPSRLEFLLDKTPTLQLYK